ncbi:MAG: N,N-dimethylformamidase beta subunit family domain-containing protein, partial [Burkholderiales bacterium]
GHDEYWTKQMRDAVESARDLGVNLGFFGANTGYWQIRLEPDSATGIANRTIVAYKNAALDPNTDLALKTVRFRDLLLTPRPEAALVGVMYDYNPVDFQDIIITNCIPWICSGTTLVNGSHLTGMLGYEVDKTDLVYSPANIQVISESPYAIVNNGVPTGEIRYSNMTYYQAASGAGVFAAGSMNWNYGLNTLGTNPAQALENPAVQQITRNVLNSFVPAPPQ